MSNKKFVDFMELHAEAGINFSINAGNFKVKYIIPREKYTEWGEVFDDKLERSGIFLKKNKDYRLEFVISATNKSEELVVKGPQISRRNKFYSFALFIPYKPVISANDKLEKITKYLRQGVSKVLNKLEYTDEEIQKVVVAIK